MMLPWRSKFGGTIYQTSGSHGCVNLPPASVPATLYDHALQGDTGDLHAINKEMTGAETIKKNVPWHILAPSAVACDKLPHRASAHRWQVVPFCVLGSSNRIS